MASPRDDDNLGGLLDDLVAASKIPAKRRQTAVKHTVEKTIPVLYDRGALPGELARLVDLLTLRNHLDQASLASLVRNLYPVRKVDDEAILRIIGALGHGQLKPSLPLQGLLLRWLVMVYHLLENTAILSKTYGVLFNLLDTAAIRPQLCHLLALITRRRHVRPFRIQAILGLSRQTGSDPALIGLLRVFKNYYPEIIVGEATRGRAAAFKHPDLQWRERLDEIRQQHVERRDDGGARNGFAVNHALARQMKGAKISLIPAAHTQHAQEDSITLEEVDNPDFFVENLEKLELPTQLVAILADPLLQKLLLLRPDAQGYSRISNWLTACLGDVANGDADPSFLLDLVDVIHDYAVSTKTLPPLLMTFFRDFLETWNGRDKRETVLDALTFAPLMDFEEFHQQLLQPLEQALLDNTATSQLALLNFYTLLLRRWVVSMEAAGDLDSLPADSIPNLVNNVNKLALTLTQTSPSSLTHLAILDFYESCATIFSKPPILQRIEITIPPALVVYTMHFGTSLVVLSRLCGILASYKRAWEAVMAPPAARPLTRYEREQINTFNGFLMDLCNCLWRGHAFSTTEPNAQGCRVPPTLVPALDEYLRGVDSELALASAFGLSHSPVLCLQAIAYVRELEDAEIGGLRVRHAGPVTQSSLTQLANRGGLQISWQEYRAGVLKYLESKGFNGVPELMYNTMKNLMKGR
ncbi:Mis6-domain-containing protein [Lasiosphaeria hispida]|uniref:Mis6-domain-containing protein n=1 Tax=Lasiosphaeria hispida TaxID=260671 RepID=A0AAJ0HPW9_9PEZI|nr:Mis6-domain-containing protein [Lasiosphaeria hispida]